MKKYLKKGLKIVLWIIGSIIALFLLIVILIQVPYIQNIVKDKAITFLEDKIKTPVSLDKIEIGLPKKVILEGVYFQSQEGDTLLAGEKLAVDISLFKLLSNELEINSIDLKGITANVKRNQDAVFNFDYIIDAFASEEEKPKDTTSSMKISVRKINLDRINIKFDDAVTKNNINVKLFHFDTNIKNFDLDNMDFEIPEINLEGLNATLKQGIVAELAHGTQELAEEASTQPDLKLKLGKINLEKINLAYDNEGSKMNTGLVLEKLLVEVKNIDLKGQMIDLDKINIDGIKGNLAFGITEKQIQESLPEETSEVASSQWKFRLKDADFKNIDFKFDDENAAPVKTGIDYKHLDISNLNLEAENLSYMPDAISGNIKLFTVQDKSGLDIKQLQTDFSYGPQSAALNNLYLETPQTLVKDKIIASYPSLEALSTNIGELGINASLNGSQIGFKDILLFVPDLAKTNPFKGNPNGILYINSEITGKVNNLDIASLELSGIGTTKVSASGRITGLPDTKTAYFDLNVKQFQSSARDMNQLLPAGTFPATIQLPSHFAAKATFTGSLENFRTNLNLNSTFGRANVRASFDQRRKDHEKYDAFAEIIDFNVGKLIKNDSLGAITLTAKVKGTGLNPETANAAIEAQLAKAVFNGYTYRDLNVDGNIQNGNFNAEASIKDANLDFDLVANGGFKDKYPSGKIKLNLDMANLEKLNLHAGPLKLRGNLDADIADANPDNLNGQISLYQFMIANEEGQFALDSINLTAVSTAEKNTILLKSQFAQATVEGKYKVTEIGTALSNSIAKYYDTNPSAEKPKTEPQYFTFDLKVNNDPILQKIVPQLTRLEPIVISGKYNSETDSIVLNGSIPRIVYGANTLSGGQINIENDDNALVYNVSIDEIQNEQFLLSKTTLEGKLEDNILTYNLTIRDKKEDEQYMIAGNLKASENGATEISLDPEGLKLNYQNWSIAAENMIRFGKEGIYANNFTMSNENSSISLQSESEAPNAPLNVELNNFQLETLTNMIQKDEMKIKGTLEGNAELRNLTSNPVFIADLDINDFAISNDTVGTIKIQVNNEVADLYDAKVNITGNGNEVNLDGNYNTGTSSFDLTLDLAKFNMASIQAFTFGNLTESSGHLSGRFKVTGTTSSPNVRGNLDFNDVAFRVTQLNSYFKSINDNIAFTDRGISFSNFSIQDAEDNILSVNGDINTTNYSDFDLNLTVEAVNFRAINSTAKDNDFFYGDLYLDTQLNIKGSLESPSVDGRLKINEDTSLSVVLPQQDPSIADREGIVEFIDQDNQELLERMAIEKTVNSTNVTGMNVSVNIEIVKEAELNLIIDKSNGDYLNLKGEAQLTGGIDPSGKTTLTGRYEFDEGSYEMSFNFLRRKFDIQKGSYILWTGEPTDATINITAIYESQTAPLDLVDDQLGGISASERNMYKQRIPFHTLLKMEGELLKPEISFDIILPEGNYTVASNIITNTRAKLDQLRQQPSELNKQVFALLLLNRFIGENPFASQAGGVGAESIARQSVSKILSEQLNNLTADLISGVELNFDLESTDDYTTGQRENRTDLNVGVSKRLLNDRLKVTVGSSFGLEGPQQTNEETTNIAGDLALDYQLTKDGRYMVRAYRKNEYQVALQGQVIETGVGFIITMDYNKFRELFHRTEEEKEMKRRERELRKQKREQDREKEENETNSQNKE